MQHLLVLLLEKHHYSLIIFFHRLKVTFSCMMDLSKFPLDRQTCTMELAACECTYTYSLIFYNSSNKSLGSGFFALVKVYHNANKVNMVNKESLTRKI